MDNLARDAVAARAAGMTYGKWKAMQEPVKIERKPEKQVCRRCGQPLHGQQKKFCSSECQKEDYNQRRRA